MSARTRLRQAVTTPVLLGCLVVAVSAPRVTAHAASAPEPLPVYELHHGTVFHTKAPTAVLPVAGYRIGTTGNTTGPHLHLEVHPGGGDAVDPYAWLVKLRLRP